jgi:CheY-like chemotaxis protein
MQTHGKSRSKILIIDDDVELTTSIKTVLESQGYVVGTANDRASGMEEAKNESPDLIVLDVMMESNQDGFEMARELKKNPQCKDTPILMLTGIKGESGVDFKSAAGDPGWLPVDGFLDKPVTPDVLIAEIKKLLAK